MTFCPLRPFACSHRKKGETSPRRVVDACCYPSALPPCPRGAAAWRGSESSDAIPTSSEPPTTSLTIGLSLSRKIVSDLHPLAEEICCLLRDRTSCRCQTSALETPHSRPKSWRASTPAATQASDSPSLTDWTCHLCAESRSQVLIRAIARSFEKLNRETLRSSRFPCVREDLDSWTTQRTYLREERAEATALAASRIYSRSSGLQAPHARTGSDHCP